MNPPTPLHLLIPLEPRAGQRRELDELCDHVHALRRALALSVQQQALGASTTVVDVLRGAALPPLPSPDTTVVVPAVSRRTHARLLTATRAELGWTGRVGSDVIERVVDRFHDDLGAGTGARLPLHDLPSPEGPDVIPVGRVVLADPQTLEIPGLSDPYVLAYLHLPITLERAVLSAVNTTRDHWQTREADLLGRLARGRPDDAAALAQMYARYAPHLAPALPLPPASPGFTATFRGIDALVRQPAADGERRWFASLQFDVTEVAAPLYSSEVVGIDVGIRHPVCGYAPQLSFLAACHRLVWAWPGVTRRPGRVLTPLDEAAAKVRWYGHLHRELQPALTGTLLSPAGALAFGHVALEKLNFLGLGGPQSFGTFVTVVLCSYLQTLRQLRDCIEVDPAGTSTTDARTGERGVRRGLVFRGPTGPACIADANAAAVIRSRGLALREGRAA